MRLSGIDQAVYGCAVEREHSAMADAGRISRRVRYRMGNAILNTYGYALIGASAIQSFVMKGSVPGVVQIASVLIGLFFHIFAVYNAPKGETA
jgi:hypothetical protein